jgi:HD superfamily phosphodiesterase
LNLCPPGEDLDVLKRAAVYHDIGRTHDWEDEIHGRAAIVKMEELGLIYDMFPEEEDERVFRYVVEQHCVSDKTGLDSAQFYVRDIDKQQRAQMLLKIFKDADGLDRVRLGDLDERYLRHAESKRFARKAQELFNNW